MYSAIYARQSIDKEDSASIEAQIEYCKQYATTNAETYIDKGFSGKSTERPMIKKLIGDIEKNQIDTVIVYRIDRVSRNIVDFANLLELFNKHNVKFISATEQFDTTSPMGRAMVYIIMVFAQLERETIASRIVDNYRFRSSTGAYFMGGNIPYGYGTEKAIRDGKKVTVLIKDSSTSLILKDIFDRFIAEESVMRVAKYLNDAEIKTQKGNTWSSASVKRILENMTPVKADKAMYTFLLSRGYNLNTVEDEFDGTHGMCEFFKNKNKNVLTDVSDRIAVIGAHEPIIDSDTFIKAQFLLGRHSSINVGKPSKKSFLAGLIKCKCCGHSFGLKTTSRGSKKYAYYYCRGRGGRGKSTCENSIWIKQEELEDLIIDECEKYIKGLKLKMKSVKTQINEDYSRIDILEGQIKNLINNIGIGTCNIDVLLTEKITQLQKEIQDIKSTQMTAIYEEETRVLSDMVNFRNMDIDRRTEVIRKLIQEIVIDDNENVDIKFLI